MRNKKAAIELSVTAIVILILAIVILGLGLGFIRGMFGKVATQFEQQIAAEPEPPTTSGSDPLTLSRETIITNSGNTEVLKVAIYNPTSRDWVKDSAWGCANFTTQATCGTSATPQEGCVWSTMGGGICTGAVRICTAITGTDAEDRCKKQRGCMWETSCKDAVGAAPYLECKTMSKNPEEQVNRKLIMAGESAVFNYLMTIPKNIPEKTYLCLIEIEGYQKDLTIKVTK